MWVPYNPNPYGRTVGDCTVRAIAAVTGMTWQEVYVATAALGLAMGDMQTADEVWGGFLIRKGFCRNVIPNTCPQCYTVRDFCTDHPHGTYLLALSGHAVAVINGDYYDTWDSGDKVPLYYYTTEEK